MYSGQKESIKKYYLPREVVELLNITLKQLPHLCAQYPKLKIVKIRGRKYYQGEQIREILAQKILSQITNATGRHPEDLGRSDANIFRRQDTGFNLDNTKLYNQLSLFDCKLTPQVDSPLELTSLANLKKKLESLRTKLITLLS
ncbi:MAG: hypothetical protein SFT68_01280 [Rickettsiaceae bacterium]|nr:hypothetical protein [Rickettsiaceae bacterium]